MIVVTKPMLLDETGQAIVEAILSIGGSAYMRVYNGYIQYSKDNENWVNLIALSELKGADGADGDDGNGIASAELNADYTLTLTFTDGTSYTTPSIRGAAGEDGDTPVKGTDYWTAADKEEIVQDVLDALPTWEGGSY